MPHYVASDLGLHCLLIIPNWSVVFQKTPSKQMMEDHDRVLDAGKAIDLSKPSHDTVNSQGSLVSMILNAAKSQDNKTLNSGEPVKSQNEAEMDSNLQPNQSDNNKNSNVEAVDINSNNADSPGTVSRRNLGFTGNSAFAPVKSGSSSECLKSTIIGQNYASATVSNGQGVQEVNAKPTMGDDKDSESLPEQVTKALEMFVEVKRLVSLIEKASRSALQDMRSEK